MSELISELRTCFKPFEQYWFLWAESIKTKFNDDEMTIINSYIYCDFEYPLQERPDELKQIITKLNISYPYYQQHFINLFRELLAKYCIENNQLKSYYAEINELDFSDGFKDRLLQFKARYLLELILPDPRFNLKHSDNFSLVCRALKCLWSYYYIYSRKATI